MQRRTLFTLILFMIVLVSNATQSLKKGRHLEVSMRMVGHEVLRFIGDTTSIIKPILHQDDKYVISFDEAVRYNPETTNGVIDSVMAATNASANYIVEFISFKTGEIVYSYEANEADTLAPCQGRAQPLDRYDIHITLLDEEAHAQIRAVASKQGHHTDDSNAWNALLLMLGVLIISAALALHFTQNRNQNPDGDLYVIGGMQFNSNRMELHFDGATTILTSKEAELLQLLCASANKTVERDTILKAVWDDDGDYIGRTLDVYISKLRKKLERESKARIVNIRGIGYKLILD